MIQILFQAYAQTGLHHKTPIPPPPLPLVHNPQVTLWVGRHYSPIPNYLWCKSMHSTVLQCTMGEKKKGGGGHWGGGRGEEWWTETGKINRDVVSSRVLMSTTQGHVRKKYKINRQKEKTKREKDMKY